MGSYLGCAIIKESTVGMIENFGKFDRIVYPGCNCINCFTEKLAYTPSLKVETSNIKIETVTKESLSVTITVGIQYKINNENIELVDNLEFRKDEVQLDNLSEKSNLLTNKKYGGYQNSNVIHSILDSPIYKATYLTKSPISQISQFINSYFRTISCNHTMKDLFNSKNKLSNELEQILNKEMNKFGYIICKALIIDIDPPDSVKQTMNLVLASQNKRDAMLNDAEAQKAAAILHAEGIAETRRLEGIGLSQQRQALVDGLKQSVNGLCGEQAKLDPNELTSTIITMQYIDMLNTAATSGKNTFILQCNPGAASNVEDQVRTAILSSRK